MSAEPRDQHTYIEQYDGHTIIYDRGPTSWGAYVEDLPICFAVAATFADCQRLIKEGITIHLDELRRRGQGDSS